MSRVCVFLAEGFEEIEALTVVDLLRRAEIEITMVSVGENINVTGSHKITVRADQLFEQTNFDKTEVLVLPGGMPGTVNLGKHKGLCELIKEFDKHRKKLAAICAAPSILGDMGILDGKRATSYPGLEERLKGASVTKNPVEVSEWITTSRGLGTAISFSLSLIEQLAGKAKAEEISAAIIYEKN